MAATEIKAQLSYLRQLLHHSQADTLENRRHYNRLVQQYKALRGGAAVKAPKLNDSKFFSEVRTILELYREGRVDLNIIGLKIYHKEEVVSYTRPSSGSTSALSDEDPVVKMYGEYLRSDDTLCLLVLTTKDGHDDYHWGLYNTAKETWHFPASSEKGVVLDPSLGAAEDPDADVEVHPPPASADGAPPEEVADIQLDPPAEEEDF